MSAGNGKAASTNALSNLSLLGVDQVLSSSTQHHPQRVAMWFSWGDLGYTAVKNNLW